MRWVFILLIALNLLVYVQHSQHGPVEVGQGMSSVGEISLLSELGDPAEGGQLSDRDVEAACGILAGLEQESDALALRGRLLNLGIEARLEPVDTDAGVDYWVYLPPSVSRQAAERQLKDLQASNVGSHIITDGALANGISLGIFSNIQAAEALQRRMKSLEYGVVVRELARTQRSYRLALDGLAWRQLSGLSMSQIADDFPSVQMKQKTCAGIATEEQVK